MWDLDTLKALNNKTKYKVISLMNDKVFNEGDVLFNTFDEAEEVKSQLEKLAGKQSSITFEVKEV